MRTIIVAVLFVSMLSPASTFAKSFGSAIELSEETAISSILDHPESYVDRKVKVSGLIIDDCTMRGC